MKYDFNNSEHLQTVPNNSFLMLDNIYDGLHEAYLNGKSAYYFYMGTYFLSSQAKNENDRNNMYLKLYGKSRAKHIAYRLECLYEDLINLGIKQGCNLDIWSNYVDDYINNIFSYPYTDPIGFFEILLKTFKKNPYNPTTNELINGLFQTDTIILKGIGILLKEDNPLKEKINTLFGTTRQ